MTRVTLDPARREGAGEQPSAEIPPALAAQIARFIDYLTVERGLSRNTLEGYRRDLIRYGRHLGAAGAQDATAVPEELVSGFVARLSATSYSEGHRYEASSVARALAAVRMFHLFLLREGETETNPAEGVARPKVPRTLPRPLSMGDVNALLQACGGGDAAGLRD